MKITRHPDAPDSYTLDAEARRLIRDALQRRINALQSAAGDMLRVSNSPAAFGALKAEWERVGAVLDALGEP